MSLKISLSLLLLVHCTWAQTPKAEFTMVFGSCLHQDKPLPTLSKAAKEKADVFLFLGDNIYGDTDIMDTLEAKYARLAGKQEFEEVYKYSKHVIATWDDHDYGRNDAGSEYPFKQESKRIFTTFWGDEASNERLSRDGVYTSYYFKIKSGKVIQILLLDTRWFRFSPLPVADRSKMEKNDYGQILDTNASILGEMQWLWLEQELHKKADLRVIATSTQFATQYNGWETWANFPHEQRRMFSLIKDSHSKGVIFVSGDVHYAELSKKNFPGLYPIYDLTSSGISEVWSYTEANANRVGKPYLGTNYGVIKLWSVKNGGYLELLIKNELGEVKIQHKINLSQLK